jgi:acyl-CoA dehydrogenase
LQQLARKFCREEIIPKAAGYDQSMKYPWDIIKKAWELGLSNCHIPRHCGEYKIGHVNTEFLEGELFLVCNTL